LGYDKFKSKFVNDLSQFENIKAKIPLLKSTLDRVVEKELPYRDSYKSFQIRNITNSESLKINCNLPYLMCKYSSKKKCVLVGTLAPAWSSGWKDISKDSFVSDQIKCFFHFANQYIYRGYQINLIGAIALTYGKSCDFRGNELSQYQLPYCNSEYIAFRNDIPTTRNKRNHMLERYLELINSFDPFVNKILHYYIRSLSLQEDGYIEEAITAADNAVDVIFQAIKQRQQLPTMDRKNMYAIIKNEINLPNGIIEQLENLYQLRCGFSAHPAVSKWWDFHEIYESDMEKIIPSVKATIVKFLVYEKNNRQIDNTPSSWSQWFLDNCDTVYDAVWFHNLPKLNM